MHTNSSVGAIIRRITAVEQSLAIKTPEGTPLNFIALPYKDHDADIACQCVNPLLTNKHTHYLISYHPRAGVRDEMDALVQQVKAGYDASQPL